MGYRIIAASEEALVNITSQFAILNDVSVPGAGVTRAAVYVEVGDGVNGVSAGAELTLSRVVNGQELPDRTLTVPAGSDRVAFAVETIAVPEGSTVSVFVESNDGSDTAVALNGYLLAESLITTESFSVESSPAPTRERFYTTLPTKDEGHYTGRLLEFRDGNLEGQVRPVIHSETDSGSTVLTVLPLTGAPSSGDMGLLKF